MQHTILSDHIGEQVRALRGAREADLAQRWAQQQAIASSVTSYRQDAREQIVRGFKRVNAVTVIEGTLRAAHAYLGKTIPSQPMMADETDEERRWIHGGLAEVAVLELLFQQLAETNAVIISGYKNPSGEIDIIVVMERGAAAIEVKGYKGHLSAADGVWWADRYHQFGTWVERRRLHDDAGRTPAQQLNQAADQLSRFLTKRSCCHSLKRAVVLSHPDAWIGSINADEERLHLITRLDHLNIAQLCEPLDSTSVYRHNQRRTWELTEQDHYFHEG